MKADAMTEAAVRAVLDQMGKAYAERNLNSLLAILAPDADVVMYGTGADEKRLGRAEIQVQAERDWSQSDATALKYGWMSVSAAGSVAWVATDATFEVKAGGAEMAFPGRLTCVLERRGDTWLIVQAHFSLPAGGQVEGESFPT